MNKQKLKDRLEKIIPKGMHPVQFGKAIWEHLPDDTVTNRSKIKKQVTQLENGVSIKYSTLDKIEDVIKKDYGEILGGGVANIFRSDSQFIIMLKKIASETGLDYNEILNYDGRE